MNGDGMPTTCQHGVAVQYDPELKKRHLLEAARRLPGPDYYEVLRCVHRILKPKTYVEIGIRDGASLACALPDTRCAGVDPAPTIFPPTPVNVRVYAMTSDDFFAGHSPQDAFGTVRFDFAFIDGLHLFEQALLDFIHLERWAGPRSIIAIHDCLPAGRRDLRADPNHAFLHWGRVESSSVPEKASSGPYAAYDPYRAGWTLPDFRAEFPFGSTSRPF